MPWESFAGLLDYPWRSLARAYAVTPKAHEPWLAVAEGLVLFQCEDRTADRRHFVEHHAGTFAAWLEPVPSHLTQANVDGRAYRVGHRGLCVSADAETLCAIQEGSLVGDSGMDEDVSMRQVEIGNRSLTLFLRFHYARPQPYAILVGMQILVEPFARLKTPAQIFDLS